MFFMHAVDLDADNGINHRERPQSYVFIETFGCQMNENDSDRLLDLLKDINYLRTNDATRADLVIINTCSVRDKAEQKAYSMLGRFRTLKRERPGLVICVAGCVAQSEGERLLKRMPYLDIVIGTHNIHRLKALLEEVNADKKRVSATEFHEGIDDGEYRASSAGGGVKAFVSIMRGCNNHCSYCIVPYTRGAEVSRPSRDITAEVRELSARGVKEITLLGQNVNSYSSGGIDFAGLLKEVCAVSSIQRVRFVTSHPKDLSNGLVGMFASEEKLASHVHLPLQSGSDRVLGRMERGYTREDYFKKIEMIRRSRPGISVTSDIIVGFPSETDRDFEDTLEAVKTLRFDNIFSFMYSPRLGTKAAAFFDSMVSLEVKSERLKTLQAAQREITSEKDALLLDSAQQVLVEGPSKMSPHECVGRTSCGRTVNLPVPASYAGGMVSVRITGVYANSLRGVVSGNGCPA